jgi:hypothetical protein
LANLVIVKVPIYISVVYPDLFFPDPDPTLTLISDPDSNLDPDPACV